MPGIWNGSGVAHVPSPLLGANDKGQAAGYYSMSQNKLNP